MTRRVSFAPLVGLLALVAGCGDDGEGGAAGPGPAITPAHCPAAPSDVTLNEVAPYWGGLLVVEATIAGGTPDGMDIEVLDPALGGWSRAFGTGWQKEDGRFAYSITPNVTEHNRDGEFRVRVRSRLTGCPPSAWVEGPSYRLENPLSDTTWTWSMDMDPARYQLAINRYDVVDLTYLPQVVASLEGPFEHTVQFSADGTFSETVSFSFAAGEEDQPFAGCSFVLSYTGTWELVNRYQNILRLSARVPAEDPTAGSTCSNPALSALALNDAEQVDLLGLGSTSTSLQIDYSGLLYSSDAEVELENSTLVNDVLNGGGVFRGLAYETDAETGSFSSSYLSPEFSAYVKQ